MTDEVRKALENHKKGYNCAQAVACAFSEQLGMDEKEVFKLMEPFGFGMGTMGTCGAVSAMAAVVGMNVSDGNLEVPTTKRKSYQDMKALTEKFLEKNSSVICVRYVIGTYSPAGTSLTRNAGSSLNSSALERIMSRRSVISLIS